MGKVVVSVKRYNFHKSLFSGINYVTGGLMLGRRRRRLANIKPT